MRLGVNLARLPLLMVIPAALGVIPVPVVVPVVSAPASSVVPLLVVGVVTRSVHDKLADCAIRGSPLDLAPLLPEDGALPDRFGLRWRVIGMAVIDGWCSVELVSRHFNSRERETGAIGELVTYGD